MSPETANLFGIAAIVSIIAGGALTIWVRYIVLAPHAEPDPGFEDPYLREGGR